jgi:phenylalanyl-tRNA synthetase alpha chain
MEIFGYHPDLKKWTEIGNSGMFRPEMLRPLGLPEGVRVIAWGLALERPTMIKFRVKDIRELFGHRIAIQKLVRSAQLPLFKDVAPHTADAPSSPKAAAPSSPKAKAAAR